MIIVYTQRVSDETAHRVRDLIASGICEPSRLRHILSMLERNRPLYNSDLLYLERMERRLAAKADSLQRENKDIRHTLRGPRPAADGTKPRVMIDDGTLDRMLEQQAEKKHNARRHPPESRPGPGILGRIFKRRQGRAG